MTIPSININFQISTVLQLIEEGSYIAKYFIPAKIVINKLNLPSFGIDLNMHKFSISISPMPKIFLRIDIAKIKFLFNSIHKIAGLKIESIKILTINQSNKPNLAINLSKIHSYLTFDEKSRFDLTKMNFKSIKKMPQRIAESQPLKYISIKYKMDLIQVNYTHFFAKILIYFIFKLLINFKAIPFIPNISLENLPKIKLYMDCLINTILINFVIIDPFASAALKGVKLIYNEKWEASINDLALLPISKDETLSSTHSFMIKLNEEEDLISMSIQDGQLFILLGENKVYVDFKLLFYLVKFMMSSPLLKIKPLLMQIKQLKNPNEIIQKVIYILKRQIYRFLLQKRVN